METSDQVGCEILSDELWEDIKFEVALVSASQDHVCDELDCSGYFSEVSPGSSRGQCFVVGNGGRLSDMGQRRRLRLPIP